VAGAAEELTMELHCKCLGCDINLTVTTIDDLPRLASGGYLMLCDVCTDLLDAARMTGINKWHTATFQLSQKRWFLESVSIEESRKDLFVSIYRSALSLERDGWSEMYRDTQSMDRELTDALQRTKREEG
jgi:hypothetical protein